MMNSTINTIHDLDSHTLVDIQASLSSAQADIIGLTQELEATRQKVTEYELQIITLKTELKTVNQDLTEYTKEYFLKSSQIASLTRDLELMTLHNKSLKE